MRRIAAAAIVRYLDSGQPVVVALADMGQNVGHAITAVGFVEDAGGPCRAGVTYDCFVRALIVHDDQRGPYRKTRPRGGSAGSPVSVMTMASGRSCFFLSFAQN